MIKMNYKQFADRGFVRALQGLTSAQLPIKASYQIKKMVDELTSAQKKIIAEHTDGVAKFKKPVEPQIPAEANAESPEIKAAIAAFEAEVDAYEAEVAKFEEEFGAREFTISRSLLHYDLLGADFKITPADLTYLAPIFEDMEVVPTPSHLNVVS